MRVVIAAGVLLFSAAPAFGAVDAEVGTNTYVGLAHVVRTEPIVARHVERVPVKRCAWEYAPERRRYHDRYDTPRTRRMQRCRTSEESRVRETITGYEVTLRYNGETFTRRTDTQPGARMPVQVEVALLND